MTLAEFIEETGMPAEALAGALNVSPDTVHRYITGARIPEWDVLARLNRLTRGCVTPNDFLPKLTLKKFRYKRVKEDVPAAAAAE